MRCDGRLRYRFKRPGRDGTTHLVPTPEELIEKRAALVSAPRTNLARYCGVFAPRAKWTVHPKRGARGAVDAIPGLSIK
jgi:Putative transposase